MNLNEKRNFEKWIQSKFVSFSFKNRWHPLEMNLQLLQNKQVIILHLLEEYLKCKPLWMRKKMIKMNQTLLFDKTWINPQNVIRM